MLLGRSCGGLEVQVVVQLWVCRCGGGIGGNVGGGAAPEAQSGGVGVGEVSGGKIHWNQLHHLKKKST